MRIVRWLLLLCLLSFGVSCQCLSPVAEMEPDPFLISGDDLMHGKWMDESLITKDIRCRGELHNDKVLCDIVNVSDHDLIVNRGVNGFSYLVKYQTKAGKVLFQERLTPIEWRFEHIEILGPLKLPELCIASWASTSFAIKLPSDCARLLGVIIRVAYTSYAKMGQCNNAIDLRNIFDQNTRHVPVEFPREHSTPLNSLDSGRQLQEIAR